MKIFLCIVGGVFAVTAIVAGVYLSQREEPLDGNYIRRAKVCEPSPLPKIAKIDSAMQVEAKK